MIVKGFRFAGVASGIKKRAGAPDLALAVADAASPCAGVFTRNRVVAAPVVYSRERLRQHPFARAVVVNSGNANACTGEQGLADARRMAALTGQAVGCTGDEVQVCSTGVIGAPLPMDRLEAGIPAAFAALRPDGLEDFADAICTTDTRRKVRSASAHIGGAGINVAGASKGAGMIHPNMATMLGFVFTDAAVDPAQLAAIWRRVCDRSFNAITIDGDTSTNDTALLLASGAAGTPLDATGLRTLEDVLDEVAGELARDILRDAEGGTKVVSVRVTGARHLEDARRASHAIALSPLVKTALHGEDPNWGRIVAAAGRSGADFDPQAVRLWIGEVFLYDRGRWLGKEAEVEARAVMQRPEYGLRLDLAAGPAEHTLHTCDFGADYVRINADYRS